MSKAVTISIPHDLGRAEARRRMEQGFSQLGRQLGDGAASQFHKHWDGDRLNFSIRAMGQSISGMLDVVDDAVRIELHLPNVLALMGDKIKGRLRKAGQLLLEKK